MNGVKLEFWINFVWWCQARDYLEVVNKGCVFFKCHHHQIIYEGPTLNVLASLVFMCGKLILLMTEQLNAAGGISSDMVSLLSFTSTAQWL
jgi:hypothetical protein